MDPWLHGQRPGRLSPTAHDLHKEAVDDASRQWRQATDKLRDGFPKLAEFIERAETDVLAYIGFPRGTGCRFHPQIRSNG